MNYPITDRATEDERLVAQSRLFDPITLRLLVEAGLAPGMRVLDLGSGAGNVARLVAELVGPDGAVVGVEQDPAAVELARPTWSSGSATHRPWTGSKETSTPWWDGSSSCTYRTPWPPYARPHHD
jgi:predicted RNA methylase